jgi:DNA polymerase-3 subunit gamma/tau
MLIAAVVPSAQELRSLIETPEEDLNQIVTDAKAFTVEQTQELFRILSQAEDALRLSAHPRFVLESAAIRATRLTAGVAATPAAPAVAPPAPPRQAAPSAAPASAGRPPAGQNPAAQTRPAAPAKPAAPSPSSPATAALRPAPPKPSAQPAAAKPAPAAPTPVRLNWEQVVEHVSGRHPNIGAFLEMGSLLGIDGNQLTVGYPASASVARGMLEKPDTQRLVADLCAELAGQPVRLKIVELADGQAAAPTPAQARAARTRSQKDALLEQTRAHPLVKQARDVFGSDVVDVRQVPPRKESAS